jgi:hypothetical protein
VAVAVAVADFRPCPDLCSSPNKPVLLTVAARPQQTGEAFGGRL